MYGQFGGGLRYNSVSPGKLDRWFSDAGVEYPGQALTIHLNYWVRARNVRIEVLPELAYAHGLIRKTSEAESSLSALSVGANVDIYPFDFRGDCDCPTFSKQGTRFQRGFFLEGSLLGDAQFLKIEPTSEGDLQYDGSRISMRLGGGIGFDIGISDLVTITPVLSVQYRLPAKWENLGGSIPGDAPAIDGEVVYSAGLRVLFRPDYLRKIRR